VVTVKEFLDDFILRSQKPDGEAGTAAVEQDEARHMCCDNRAIRWSRRVGTPGARDKLSP
jgi:hypothetical protein